MSIGYASLEDMAQIGKMEITLFGISDDFHGTSNTICTKIATRIVGYVNFRTTRNTVYIDSLGVDKHFRRKGYGNRMLQFAMHLRPTTKLMVETSNVKALNLYKKNGMRVVEEINNYYDVNRHAYEMHTTP